MQKIILGVVAIGVLGGAVVLFGDNMKNDVTGDSQKMLDEKQMTGDLEMQKTPEAADGTLVDMKKEEVMTKEADTEMMKKEDTTMQKDSESMTDDTMKKAGLYTTYNADKLAMAATGDVVLFFKASWCPSCRTLDADIKSKSTTIPSSLTILEVDYDTAIELKKKYGVTTQHTLVQVNASGEMITKWSGGSTLESVVAKVQ